MGWGGDNLLCERYKYEMLPVVQVSFCGNKSVLVKNQNSVKKRSDIIKRFLSVYT